MPGTIKVSPKGLKRKSKGDEKRPSKRPRSESDSEDSQAQILSLETEIFESKKNYNNIAKLVKLLQKFDSDDAIVAAVSLCRVFTRLMAAGDFTRSKSSTEKERVVIQWLNERYAEYKVALLELMKQEAAGSTALTICMRTLLSEGTHLVKGQDYCFPTGFLRDILMVLIGPEVEAAVRKEFMEKYLENNDDIRFYTFEIISYVVLLKSTFNF